MATKLTTVFGWWDWDAETPALVNRVTGERVAFRGRFADPEFVPAEGSWLRFDYLHPELNFPLLVEERPAEDAKNSGEPVWCVDYPRSSALWARQSGEGGSHPTYGIWRRVDDCITDAFACWPESEAISGALARQFCLAGGWLNGRWQDELAREELRASGSVTSKRGEACCNTLVSLSLSPPPSFAFIDHIPHRNGNENWDVENPVLLGGVTFGNPELRQRPYLPDGNSFASLKGRTAHLLSSDGRRLLYPFYGDTSADIRRGHWTPRFALLYADDWVAFTCSALPSEQTSADASWHIAIENDFVLRSPNPNQFFLVERHQGPLSPLPSRLLSLHVKWGILDGWSCWAGTQATNPDWLPMLKLLRTKSTSISFGYVAGNWSVSARTEVSASSRT